MCAIIASARNLMIIAIMLMKLILNLWIFLFDY